MAYQSVVDKALARIRGTGKGAVFSAIDFLDLGSRSSVDQALSRLTKSGAIRRLGRGLYDFPRVNKRLGILAPSPESIARAIERKTGARVQPSGAQSANALGLSTQVPTRVVYRTTGPARRIRTGKQTIEFRQSVPSKLEGAGTPARATIEALRHIGKGRATEEVLSRIGTLLSPIDKKHLARLKKSAPTWMHSLIDRIISHPSENDG